VYFDGAFLAPRTAAKIRLAMSKQHYFFKLIPPRPTFPHDMNDERRLMDEHGRYFQEHFVAGKLLLYGCQPVRAADRYLWSSSLPERVPLLLDGDNPDNARACRFKLLVRCSAPRKPAYAMARACRAYFAVWQFAVAVRAGCSSLA